ncbi:LuxR C-terminal-related transcriptional regulator [Mycobacterium sp. MMS18-G62]
MIRQWPLVGRSEELAIIAEATRAPGDRARGIVLSGNAGVGKTRVAREAVHACGPRTARRQWIVGTASGRTIPLGAFASVASDFGPDPLRRVREVIDGLVGDKVAGEVILGVDDAHLLDELSAFTVHQLVTRRLATVILTIRSGETPPDAVTAIWKDQHLQRLELQPLALAEVTRLVEHVLDGPVHSASAHRLWQYTQGNALYLRHLLENEVKAQRIKQHSGVWLWDGQPKLSPTLKELLQARMADVPATVCDVLAALAVAEPLESEVLESIADADALAEAETLGLVTIDSDVEPATVRLTHPLVGEVVRTDSMRLRRLRGRLATTLAERGSTDPRDVVRHAVLAIGSDHSPAPEHLLAAAGSAMQLGDLRLAERLAERAVGAGGGPECKLLHAMAMTWQEQGAAAESILAELANETSGPVRAQIAILRAINFAVVLGHVTSAEGELELLPDDDPAVMPLKQALKALIALVRGNPQAAVAAASTADAESPGHDLAHMLTIWVRVAGFADLGRIDEIGPLADVGYAVANESPEAAHLRQPLALLQAYGYRFAGALTDSDAVVARIRRDTIDVPFEESWHSLLVGMSAMSRGALDHAQRSLREAIAYLGTGDSGRIVKSFARSWLATVTAMAGRATDARREFDAIEWWAEDPDASMTDGERSMTQAWVCAAEGAVSQAISITSSAASREFERGRPAWEVVLLQAATQFGDPTTATRLAELSALVQGPRASAAAAHAAALAATDGDALLDASRQYEAFGDRIAAADAAAHAVVAYQRTELRGAAMNASAIARRLAAECQGAQTPAMRAAMTVQPFTDRQREIISLAACGLSNKDIAHQLTMSVRSVEGHLFRASQRVGANNREQLIAMLNGAPATDT